MIRSRVKGQRETGHWARRKVRTRRKAAIRRQEVMQLPLTLGITNADRDAITAQTKKSKLKAQRKLYHHMGNGPREQSRINALMKSSVKHG